MAQSGCSLVQAPDVAEKQKISTKRLLRGPPYIGRRARIACAQAMAARFKILICGWRAIAGAAASVGCVAAPQGLHIDRAIKHRVGDAADDQPPKEW
jgi:hypothetical protein